MQANNCTFEKCQEICLLCNPIVTKYIAQVLGSEREREVKEKTTHNMVYKEEFITYIH